MKSLTYFLFFILILLSGIVGGLYYQQSSGVDFKFPFRSLKTSIINPVANPTEKVVERVVEIIIPKTPCEKTLYYSFGEIDERHRITPESLRKIMQQVENIWEDGGKYNLFEYRENAEFKINFIFDERQERTLLNRDMNARLVELKKSQKSLFSEHTELTDEYDSLWKEYKEDLNDFEDSVKSYNDDIAYWNDKGGAPEEEYNELIKEGEKISEIQEDLEDHQKKINKLVKKINKLANKGEDLVDEYNAEVTTYNSTFGSSKRFSQGEYFGTGINIYQFREDSDLRLVLAHEFGHALTLEHIGNPKSIMYYLMGEQDLNNIKLTEEDISALNEVCYIETIR